MQESPVHHQFSENRSRRISSVGPINRVLQQIHTRCLKKRKKKLWQAVVSTRRLKMRERKTRHRQKCRGGKRGTSG